MPAYCQKPKGMSTGDYFFAIYVLLSRATKLDDPAVGWHACEAAFRKKACWRCLSCNSG